jgi:hypothetical protein
MKRVYIILAVSIAWGAALLWVAFHWDLFAPYVRERQDQLAVMVAVLLLAGAIFTWKSFKEYPGLWPIAAVKLIGNVAAILAALGFLVDAAPAFTLICLGIFILSKVISVTGLLRAMKKKNLSH